MSPDQGAVPPRIAQALLGAVIPDRELREGVLGDLHELFLMRAAQPGSGVRAARRWYRVQAARLGVGYALARFGFSGRGFARRGFEHRGSKASPGDGSGQFGPFRAGQGVRAAARAVRRDLASATVGATTLAIGFGAAATIFAVWQGFTRELPMEAGSEIVQIRILDQARSPVRVAWDDVRDLDEWTTLDGFAAFQTESRVLASSGTRTHRVATARVSPSGLRALGVQPTVGRLPSREDEAVLLLGRDESTRLGSTDEDAVGRSMRLDGASVTGIGVMPEDFAFPFRQAAWTTFEPADGDLPVELFALLGEGQSRDAAAAEVLARLSDRIPVGSAVDVLGFTEARGEGGEQVALIAVLALAVVLLFVSCSNVSNLLLIRGLERSRQLAVHQALGASPLQVAWIVMVESVLIAGLGAAAGLGIATGATHYIQSSLQGHWGYYWMEVRIDPSALVFLFGLGLATAVVAGLLPALRAFGADVRGGLGARDGGGSSTRSGWIGATLLTTQVSLSFLFLLAALLMARGLVSAGDVDADFPSDDVFLASVTRPTGVDMEERERFRMALDRGLRSHADVGRATVTTGVPGVGASLWTVEREGRPLEPGERPTGLAVYGVTPGFFDVFELEMTDGRALRAGDMGADADPVMVVDRGFALDELGTVAATGLRVRLRVPGADTLAEYEIVGVVDELPLQRADARTRSAMIPVAQDPSATVYAVYRPATPAVDAPALAGAVVGSIDPDLPLNPSVTPGGRDQGVSIRAVLDYTRTVFTTAGALGIAGGLAAVLVAALGLYGMLAYEMSNRRRELGIRLALGSGRRRVMQGVVGRGLRSIAPGLALGLGAALLSLPLLGVLMGDASARDLGLLSGALLAYAAVAVGASLMPAIRAGRVDPSVTLREE